MTSSRCYPATATVQYSAGQQCTHRSPSPVQGLPVASKLSMPSKDTKELEFPHSDGNENLWPSNTTRLVDSEGHVNYMHPIVADDDWDVRWRKSVGGAVAVLMKLPSEFLFSFISVHL